VGEQKKKTYGKIETKEDEEITRLWEILFSGHMNLI
jgi:hypothetical protein